MYNNNSNKTFCNYFLQKVKSNKFLITNETETRPKKKKSHYNEIK